MTTAHARSTGTAASAADVVALPRQDVYTALGTASRGLTDADAGARVATYGSNTLPPPQRPSPMWRFLGQFRDMFAVVLLTASAICFLAYALEGFSDVGKLQLAVAILAVVMLNAVIGFAQEYSAERTVQALQAMVPHVCRVLRAGERREIAAAELVPGDVVAIESGDAVPADCRLVAAQGLTVDNAALTGESRPVTRRADAVPAAVPLIEARNCVLMGTTVATGTAKAVVFATGTRTEFGRIFRLTTETGRKATPLQLQVAVLARRVSGIALAVGAIMFGLRIGTGSPVIAAFVFGLGVMVALVPEGLPATLSVSLAVGVRRMARRRALVKRLLAVEALGSTTVICTDKTGTLTQAEMTVQRCWASGRFQAVSGVGYAPEGEVEDAAAVRGLLRAAGLCSNARLLLPDDQHPWRVLGDPTEGALLVAAAKAGVDLAAEEGRTPRVAECPFDPVRKRMSTVHRVDEGEDGTRYQVCVKGSPHDLLNRCEWIEFDGERVALNDTLCVMVAAAADEMARDSLRVLGVAVGTADQPDADQDTIESKLTFVGLIGMIDPPRPTVAEAVRACRRAGIRMIMVTGDHPLTAEAIARRVGIVSGGRPVVVAGSQLTTMAEPALDELLGTHGDLLFCRVSPQHKMRIVTALERRGEVVAVTGDGANDAPALKRADIGVAMGAGGTDVAREAAAIVLLDDSFASIVTAVEVGRSVYRNIRKFLVYLFVSNVGELTPIVVATFVGFPLVPITVVQILAIDLGSDVLPSLALGAEPPERDVMDDPPRKRTEPLFTAALLRRLLFLGGIQALGAVAAFFWTIHASGLPWDAITESDAVYREALTMTQAAIVVSQIFVGLTIRSDRESLFRIGLLSNPRYLAAQGVALAIIAAISYVPLLQSIFHTAPLSVSGWFLVLAFGLVLLFADELRKYRLRRRSREA